MIEDEIDNLDTALQRSERREIKRRRQQACQIRGRRLIIATAEPGCEGEEARELGKHQSYIRNIFSRTMIKKYNTNAKHIDPSVARKELARHFGEDLFTEQDIKEYQKRWVSCSLKSILDADCVPRHVTMSQFADSHNRAGHGAKRVGTTGTDPSTTSSHASSSRGQGDHTSVSGL